MEGSVASFLNSLPSHISPPPFISRHYGLNSNGGNGNANSSSSSSSRIDDEFVSSAVKLWMDSCAVEKNLSQKSLAMGAGASSLLPYETLEGEGEALARVISQQELNEDEDSKGAASDSQRSKTEQKGKKGGASANNNSNNNSKARRRGGGGAAAAAAASNNKTGVEDGVSGNDTSQLKSSAESGENNDVSSSSSSSSSSLSRSKYLVEKQRILSLPFAEQPAIVRTRVGMAQFAMRWRDDIKFDAAAAQQRDREDKDAAMNGESENNNNNNNNNVENDGSFIKTEPTEETQQYNGDAEAAAATTTSIVKMEDVSNNNEQQQQQSSSSSSSTDLALLFDPSLAKLTEDSLEWLGQGLPQIPVTSSSSSSPWIASGVRQPNKFTSLLPPITPPTGENVPLYAAAPPGRCLTHAMPLLRGELTQRRGWNGGKDALDAVVADRVMRMAVVVVLEQFHFSAANGAALSALVEATIAEVIVKLGRALKLAVEMGGKGTAPTSAINALHLTFRPHLRAIRVGGIPELKHHLDLIKKRGGFHSQRASLYLHHIAKNLQENEGVEIPPPPLPSQWPVGAPQRNFDENGNPIQPAAGAAASGSSVASTPTASGQSPYPPQVQQVQQVPPQQQQQITAAPVVNTQYVDPNNNINNGSNVTVVDNSGGNSNINGGYNSVNQVDYNNSNIQRYSSGTPVAYVDPQQQQQQQYDQQYQQQQQPQEQQQYQQPQQYQQQEYIQQQQPVAAAPVAGTEAWNGVDPAQYQQQQAAYVVQQQQQPQAVDYSNQQQVYQQQQQQPVADVNYAYQQQPVDNTAYVYQQQQIPQQQIYQQQQQYPVQAEDETMMNNNAAVATNYAPPVVINNNYIQPTSTPPISGGGRKRGAGAVAATTAMGSVVDPSMVMSNDAMSYEQQQQQQLLQQQHQQIFQQQQQVQPQRKRKQGQTTPLAQQQQQQLTPLSQPAPIPSQIYTPTHANNVAPLVAIATSSPVPAVDLQQMSVINASPAMGGGVDDDEGKKPRSRRSTRR